MRDVNMSSPALKLVVPDQKPARASASSQAANDQVASRARPTAPARELVAGGAASPLKAEPGGIAGPEQAEELREKIARLNDHVQSVHRELEFRVDDSSGQTVVTVIDPETEEVVRQIPDELALRLAEKLQQDEPLTLLNIEV